MRTNEREVENNNSSSNTLQRKRTLKHHQSGWMMEMPLENDSNYGYCGEGAEEALDNAWMSLAEKVSIVEGICGD